jgi:alpha-L-rhamnosidase
LHSIHGPISSSWKKDGDAFDWSIEVPANTTATVYIPVTNGQSVSGVEDSQGVTFVREENGARVYHVGAGKYRFGAK